MLYWQELGQSLIKKCRLTSIWIPTLKIKPSYLKHGNRHTWERRSLYWNRALVSSISICPMDAAFKRLPLLWRHDGRDGVSNHQLCDCLLNRLFRCRSKKKPRVTGLCAGNSPVTGEFPAQRASNAENVSIWWRHHDTEPLGICWDPYPRPRYMWGISSCDGLVPNRQAFIRTNDG